MISDQLPNQEYNEITDSSPSLIAAETSDSLLPIPFPPIAFRENLNP